MALWPNTLMDVDIDFFALDEPLIAHGRELAPLSGRKMGRDASCLERSCVWSRMCAEVVGRDRDASSSYLVRELVDWELKLDVMRTGLALL
ncbi:hypothetical protein DY000_02040587 [Brassica cretica]|uniref:Uncharacterized protein n=1 Tax=Brassica cretica TaxID=69181 RepID=A0ABQ7BFQ7_BRACR|nr:hypothetical protein DY000_02040587 [Brassica cretica]